MDTVLTWTAAQSLAKIPGVSFKQTLAITDFQTLSVGPGSTVLSYANSHSNEH